MNKPITIAYEELSNTIVNAINESNIPAFIVRSLLKELDALLLNLSNQQLAADRRRYEEERQKELSEEKKDEDA